MYAGEIQDHECVPSGQENDSWGCHNDVVKGRFVIPCPYCFGSECKECQGKGIIHLSRCPNHLRNTAIAELGNVYRAYRWLEEKSIFPISGGLTEQSAYFMNCVEFMRAFAAVYADRKAKAADKMAKINNRKRKRA